MKPSLRPFSLGSRRAALRRSRRVKQWQQVIVQLDQEIETELAKIQHSYQELYDRYHTLKTSLQDHEHLQHDIDQHLINQPVTHDRLAANPVNDNNPSNLSHEENSPPSLPITEIHAELRQLQQQLANLELTIDSSLFSWDGFADLFWVAVRFGGLGFVLGWFLKSWAG